ncbi:MAG: HNH endonuclease [Candidatus Omnitrophica bacterium]|nr:HNH endonuclease [Candidatus Omnitrophota bacterium]
MDATPSADASVVGDECHIVSPKEQGPRFDASFPEDQLDDPANLILLCRVHHKMVDDQCETYTVEVLRLLKTNHEKWVSSTLTEQKAIPLVRVRRIKENVPTHLVRLTSGREILTIVDRASAFTFEHDDLKSPAEVELIGGFLQEAQDYGDLSGDLEAGDRVKAAFEMSTRLEELEQAGFWVFGGREVRRLEGGVGSPSPFPVAILQVLRAKNPEIVKLDLTKAAEQRRKGPQGGPTAAGGRNDV